MFPTQYLAYIRYFVIFFLELVFNKLELGKSIGNILFSSMFHNISGKRLVGQSSKLIFFCLDFNVECMSKEFSLC